MMPPKFFPRNGWALELLGEKLKAEREIVTEAIAQEGPTTKFFGVQPDIGILLVVINYG